MAGIVQLAGRLGLTTVAEGIQEPEQAAVLAALGCEMAQGYHFSRPVPEAELRQAFAAGRRALAA